MSAMDSELSLLLKTADITESIRIGGVTYHIGKLAGRNVVLCRAGVGKTLASSCTAVLINQFEVSSIVFTGIAGGVGDEVGVLDVVIATDLILHDYGRVTADGFVWNGGGGVDRGTGIIPVDEALSDIAFEAAVMVVGEDSAYRGTIVTGDQFIMSDPYVTELQLKFNALACEMEGASVARVAYAFATPVVVIRCMSDKADGLAHEVIEDFGNIAADISAGIVVEYIRNIQ
jgi:adenosylhomocysteine nucleosidase